MTNTLEYRLEMTRNHFTHYSHYIGDPIITGIPLLDQFILTCIMTAIFALILYGSVSSFSYFILFKWQKKTFTPFSQQLREYEEQKLHDIKWSLLNILGQTPLVSIIKMAYPYFSKVQYEFQWRPIMIFYILFHICYDQFLTYWFHRLLHHPKFYQKLHRIHHESKSITPFAGFAFHPLDAFIQAIPVFTSCFFVPLPIDLVILHGLITALWAISIHDNVNMVPFKGILYAGSHTIHHFPWGLNYNYGKITSICDRLYGSYCDPEQITGYGYKQNAFIKSFCDILNKIYMTIVPDNGKQRVQKQARNRILKERKARQQKIGFITPGQK